MSLEVRVIPTFDSQSVDTSDFNNVKVYLGKIENEEAPPLPPACFLGSWYRKVFSSKDYWIGIEGKVTLGEFIPDETRFNLDGKGRYMDNPSVYMGGKSATESDCGLGYNLMYTTSDMTKDLELSSPKLGYRPFWRYIYSDATDYDGNVNRRTINSWNISNPRSAQYYYFPGDTIIMKVYSPIPNYLQLRIEVVEPTTNPKYVELRKNLGVKNGKPQTFYSPIFYSQGHGIEKAEFKRVNSIDQYGNEGYYAKPTDAKVTDAIWHEVYLYRKVNGEVVKVPFTKERQASMICPNEEAITVNVLDEKLGSELIKIHPGNLK